MAVNKVDYKGNLASANTSRGPSMNLWGDCPVLEIIEDPGVGFIFFDDFLSSFDIATNQTTVLKLGPYEVYTGNGTNLLGSGGLTGTGGQQVWASGDTADINGVMQLGGGAPFMISSTAGANKKLWFECRFKISSVTDADQVQWFIGLAEEDRAAANGIFADGGGDLGFTTTIDLVGFGRFDNDGDSLSFTYQKGSATPQDVVQAALAADTYIKAGFVYDPDAPTAKRIKVFFNNLEQSTYVTHAQSIASTFPDGEELSPILSFQNDSTTSNTITIDWWRCAQLA